MTKEFRLSTAITLPSDEFNAAAMLLKCRAVRDGLRELLAKHEVTAPIEHEVVATRAKSEAKPLLPASPAAGHAPHDPAVPLRGRLAAE